MSKNRTMQNVEEASADVQALSSVVEHFDTHDLGDELDTLPEVHFDVPLPPGRPLSPLNVERQQHERQ